MKRHFRRLLPALFILIFMVFAYFSGLTDSVTLENWMKVEHPVRAFMKEHPYLAPFLFVGIYAAYVALSLPGSFVLSIIAGVLFLQPYSTLYVAVGATIGASIVFWISHGLARPYFQQKAGPFLTKMEKGFHQDAASYMLFLRLVPAFPFFLVNIAPAIFGVSFKTFLWTTFLGIIPACFVFTQAGAGLMMILMKMEGEPFTLKTIFNTQVNIALVSLGILSLIPLAIKKWKGRNIQDL